MRICFIGDSFVNGTGDDTCLGWTGRLCAAARRAGHDVTLYNLGIRRDTSTDIAGRWRREAEARLPTGEDGRLVFAFGANDCACAVNGVAVNEDGARVGRARTLANAEAMLAQARAWCPTLMIGPLPVSDDPATDARVATLSADLATLCARIGVPYLEVFAATAACEPWRRDAAAGDGTHPNARGYAALADLVGAWASWRSWFAADAHG